jgi:hypothetical protein
VEHEEAHRADGQEDREGDVGSGQGLALGNTIVTSGRLTARDWRRFEKWLDIERSMLSYEPNSIEKIGRYFVIYGYLKSINPLLRESFLPSSPEWSVEKYEEWRSGVEAACTDIQEWLWSNGLTPEDADLHVDALVSAGYDAWNSSNTDFSDRYSTAPPHTLGPTPLERIRYRQVVTPAEVLDRYHDITRRFRASELDEAVRGAIQELVHNRFAPAAKAVFGAESLSNQRAGSYLTDGYLLGRSILSTTNVPLTYSQRRTRRLNRDKLLIAVTTFDAIDVTPTLGDLSKLVEDLARRFAGSEDLRSWQELDHAVVHALSAIHMGIYLAAAEDLLFNDGADSLRKEHAEEPK